MKSNLRIQQFTLLIGIILFGIKVVAYLLTGSVSIYTDALESTVNILAAVIGLYSLYIASLPKDSNHPYGHGKAEFLSSGVEGAMITIAGFMMLYQGVIHLILPQKLLHLDWGLLLIANTGLINFVAGWYSIREGKKVHSAVLISSGRHLQSDTYSTLGILIGLLLMYFTGWKWIDAFTACVFGIFIIYSGYTILRAAVGSIMDETDPKLLQGLITFLNENRQPNWIDIHNVRVIKYGSALHIDCHLTVPWFFTIKEGHDEQEKLHELIETHFGQKVELFVHIDECITSSCKICAKSDCKERQADFEGQISWTVANVMANKKHSL